MPQLPALRVSPRSLAELRRANVSMPPVKRGTSLAKPPTRANSSSPRSTAPTRGTSPMRGPASGGCTPGNSQRTGKRCKHGVQPDGFCCPPPVRADTVVHMHEWKAGHGPGTGSGGAVQSATASAAGAAVGSAAGVSASRAALMAGAKSVGTYLAGKGLVRGAVALAGLTPYGRAARIAIMAAKGAHTIAKNRKKLAAARTVRALITG